MANETEQFEVVWPSGKLGVKKATLAPRLDDLEGKTICEFSHYSYKGDDIFPALRESLRKRYKNINFVEYDTFGNFRDPRIHGVEFEKFAGLRDLLLAHKCDAVIVGIAA